MADLEVKDQDNKKVDSVAASDDVFNVTVREHLVQRYVESLDRHEEFECARIAHHTNADRLYVNS